MASTNAARIDFVTEAVPHIAYVEWTALRLPDGQPFTAYNEHGTTDITASVTANDDLTDTAQLPSGEVERREPEVAP